MLTLCKRSHVALLSLILAVAAGCTPPPPEPSRVPAEHPLAGVDLRLAIVGDAPLAKAAGRLQGEWNAQTGSTFQVQSLSEADFESAKTLAADVVLLPAYQLGIACERHWTQPLRREVLQASAGNWSEIFDLPRLHETSWGTRLQAVSFGSPVLVCYCRTDLLKKLHRKPPQTWSEYQELAQQMAEAGKATAHPPGAWYGTAEPLALGWAGRTLLARAAAYARHRDNYSTLFQIDSLEPLIAGPPFVRALEELVAAAKLSPPEVATLDPAAVRRAFWHGQCGLALTWPTAGGEPIADTAPGVELTIGELPGARQAYNVSVQRWDQRPDDQDPHVPLLAIGGRVGAVVAGTTHADAAVQLLTWLSANQTSGPYSAVSSATTLFRQSHLAAPQQWMEKPAAAAANSYATASEEAFSRSLWLTAPRIPGQQQYLAALDTAVHQALRGELAPQAALQKAAERWRTITKDLGADAQRAAYLRSLELEP